MNIETLRHFLLWCTVIDYGILLLWSVFTLFAFGWMQRLCSRWYGISAEHFYAINFAGIVFFRSRSDSLQSRAADRDLSGGLISVGCDL